MLLTVKRLDLENFMTHRQESVEFPEQGIILLWGPSGSGKCLPGSAQLADPATGELISIERFVAQRRTSTLGYHAGRVEPVRVTDWHELGVKDLVRVHTADGRQLVAAATHPVLTEHGCRPAGQLRPGQRVATAAMATDSLIVWQTITEVEFAGSTVCYDITVDTPEHLYLADGFVVHNSSLLDAIAFALYGVKATRAKSLDELRHELYPDEPFGVRLTLRLDEDNEVQIFRGVDKNGKSIAWLAESDGTLLEGLAAVGDRVAQLMGAMDGATFFATYFAKQGELDALVSMAGHERRKFIQRMLGITLLDQVSKRITQHTTAQQGRIDQLNEQIPAQTKEELQAQLADARQQVADKTALLETLTAELEAIKSAGQSLAQRLTEGQSAATRHEELTAAITARAQHTLPALRADVTRLTELVAQAGEAKRRLDDSAAQRAELDALNREAQALAAAEGALQALERLRQDAQEAERALQARQAELDVLPEQTDGGPDVDALTARHQQATSTAQDLARQIAETQEIRASLAEQGHCPTCLRDIDLTDHDHTAHALGALDAKLQALTDQHAQATADEQALAAQLQTARAARAAAEQAARTRQQALTRHQEAGKAHRAAQAKLAEAEQAAQGGDSQRLARVRARLAELADLQVAWIADQRLLDSAADAPAQLEAAQAKLAAEETLHTQQEAELAELAFDPQGFAALQTEVEQARGHFSDVREQVATLKGELELAGRDVTAAQAQLEHYDQAISERQNATERLALLRRLEASMKAFKGFMIGQIRPQLEDTTSQHLSDLTHGRMPGVQIDEEYNLAVKRNGEFRRIGLCSGGEQARAAFSLRLALTQLVSARTDTPWGALFFDEIFGSQDEDHRRALLEALRYAGANTFPQTFLISHEQTLRDHEFVDLVVDVPDSDSVARIQVHTR